MKRRDFLMGGAIAFVGVLLRPQLSQFADAPAVVLPESSWDIGDRWRVQWSGFQSNYTLVRKRFGNWLAYPIYKNTPDLTRFPFYSSVVVELGEDVYEDMYLYRIAPPEWGDPPYDFNRIYKDEISIGLQHLMWMLKRSEELGVKHNVVGGVPVDYCGNINRRLLSQQLRKGRQLSYTETVVGKLREGELISA